jgi:predicted  nucleic acid-binding Zn-ribbon protein
VKAFQDKVDEHKLVKEEQHALEVTLQEMEDKITKHTTDCAALQSEVEQNNAQIQKVKDDIAALQKQTQGRDFDEKESREVQELEDTLNENKQQLEINVQKIEEKVSKIILE